MYDSEYNHIMGQIQDVLGIEKKNETNPTTREIDQNMLGIDVNEEETYQGSQMKQDDSSIGGGVASDPTTLQELRQKITDLKQELEMSPRQFEDKLLQKLREEILQSKQKMQEQLKQELQEERQRMRQQLGQNRQKEQLRSGNIELSLEVNKMRGVVRK